MTAVAHIILVLPNGIRNRLKHHHCSCNPTIAALVRRDDGICGARDRGGGFLLLLLNFLIQRFKKSHVAMLLEYRPRAP